ncbi:hypothetical protein [Candidatus Anaplasma sp. TIGMIC]|uniref:hypothetical protein n=1 Tax=Candidatus Anaplasma sp. TIGMIC TaxID=3020713 RepID=UPI002330C9E0|nr:hypothetical protein [Candidatus Anaplasma sp. TIGMIC]
MQYTVGDAVPEHNSSTHNNDSSGFSPWVQWTSEMDVSFHDHVAQGIKEKVLSADNISTVSLRLLTKANETTLALLKEIRYVDATWVYEVNAQALVTAQCHILEVCNILKGVSGTAIDSEPIGKRMLCAYPEITVLCYSAVTSLDSFYSKPDMWLRGDDEKSAYVSRILAFLVGAIDAMQQYHMFVCPYAYRVSNGRELEGALCRARHALRTVTNAFNTASLPKNEWVQQTGKNALLTNIYWLTAVFELLDVASHRTFSTAGMHNLTAYHNTGTISRCCRFRITLLRKKATRYMAVTDSYDQQNLVCSTAIWALDRLNDEIDAIASGTYEYFGQALHYTTGINIGTTECLSILALMRLAYIREGERNSTAAKTIERDYKMLKDAKLLCARLKLRGSGSSVDADCIEKLYDVLAYLESVRNDLMSLDGSRLLHAQWSSSMLKQAVKAIESAFDICEAKIKSAEANVAVEGTNSRAPIEGGATRSVPIPQRVRALRERYGNSTYPQGNMHVNFDQVNPLHTPSPHGGGEFRSR